MLSAPQVVFSSGAIDRLGTLFPGRSLVVGIYSGAASGLVNRLLQSCAGRDMSIFTIPDGLPQVLQVEELQNHFWSVSDRGDSVFVAMGGGSVMDAAKVIRFSPVPGESLREQLDVEVLSCRRSIPLVLCPTTSGTGSEVTSTATLWDFSNGTKHSFFGSAVQADMALIDPELTLTLPPAVTRDSGIDAISHALESIWNVRRNSETLNLAVRASQLITSALPRAMQDPCDIEAREQMSLGSLLAGQAMSVTQTSLAHALSYYDTLALGLSHGYAVGRWLPWVLGVTLKSDPIAVAWLEIALGELCSAHRFQSWLGGLGCESSLYSNTDSDLRLRVRQAIESVRGRNFSGNLGFEHAKTL